MSCYKKKSSHHIELQIIWFINLRFIQDGRCLTAPPFFFCTFAIKIDSIKISISEFQYCLSLFNYFSFVPDISVTPNRHSTIFCSIKQKIIFTSIRITYYPLLQFCCNIAVAAIASMQPVNFLIILIFFLL